MGMYKFVEKNNKIVKEWFNPPDCSGVPIRESDQLSGAAINSAACTSHNGESVKDLKIEQVPKEKTAVIMYLNDTACTQPSGGSLSYLFTTGEDLEEPKNECHSGAIDYFINKNAQVPKSSKAHRRICKSKKDVMEFHDTANCADCPKLA